MSFWLLSVCSRLTIAFLPSSVLSGVFMGAPPYHLGFPLLCSCMGTPGKPPTLQVRRTKRRLPVYKAGQQKDSDWEVFGFFKGSWYGDQASRKDNNNKKKKRESWAIIQKDKPHTENDTVVACTERKVCKKSHDKNQIRGWIDSKSTEVGMSGLPRTGGRGERVKGR